MQFICALRRQSLSGASFTSLKQLQEHIDAYIKACNDRAEPFAWTRKRSVNADSKAAVSLSSEFRVLVLPFLKA